MSDLHLSPLISAQELQAELGQGQLTMLDGTTFTPGTGLDGAAAFAQGHIPGALWFDIDSIARRIAGPPFRMLPNPDEFAADVGALGIPHGGRIVVYDTHGLYSAARVWWMFRMQGYASVQVLDGGLPAWKAAGGAIETGPAAPRPATAWPAGRLGPWQRSWQEVLAAVESGGEIIVDVRPEAQFNGDTSASYPGVRPGHIKGARHLSQRDLRRPDGRFRPKDEILALLAARGLSLESPVVASCGSGVTACILSLAYDWLGAGPIPVYDGSWEEWGARPDLPAEIGTGPA